MILTMGYPCILAKLIKEIWAQIRERERLKIENAFVYDFLVPLGIVVKTQEEFMNDISAENSYGH